MRLSVLSGRSELSQLPAKDMAPAMAKTAQSTKAPPRRGVFGSLASRRAEQRESIAWHTSISAYTEMAIYVYGIYEKP